MNSAKPRKSRAGEQAFVEHVLELLGQLGAVRSRAMFGGYGIYLGPLMIGLVADGVLYLKADGTSSPWFEAEGCAPFQYTRRGRSEPIVMSYYEAPPAALERAELMCLWGQRALEAAQRAASRRR
jgi:DNA transformation protein